MTEKEKMERGEWHDANFDEELLAKRARAEALCYDFNIGKPGSDAQLDALKTLLDTDLPAGLTVLSPAYFDYGDKTTFGDGCFVNHGCYFMDGGSITFGDNVFIGRFAASTPLRIPLEQKSATWVSRGLCPLLLAITAGLARTCPYSRGLPSAAAALSLREVL